MTVPDLGLPGGGGPGRARRGRRPGGLKSGVRWRRLDLEQLGFLVLERLVDLPGVLGGEAVELLLRALALVLADLAVLDQLVDGLLGVRRMLRTETLASSALPRATLMYSLRRSSVYYGTATRSQRRVDQAPEAGWRDHPSPTRALSWGGVTAIRRLGVTGQRREL